MSNIKSISDQFVKKLAKVYDLNEAKAIKNLVFTTVFNCNFADLVLRRNDIVEESLWKKLNTYLAELEQGKPVQYVLGETEFFNLKFIVNSAVLIPRQETELLVLWIIDDFKNSSPNILDIGTGSGIIPISLKKNIERAVVSGLDVSNDAIQLANKNAALNKVDVSFFDFDVLSGIELIDRYDIIVSNPPYVPLADKNSLHKNVIDFEPSIALFVPNEKPLLFYERIADLALHALIRPGSLYFEIYESDASEIKQMLEIKGFQKVVVRRDFAEKDRMIKAELI